jgi:hypothetical protein
MIAWRKCLQALLPCLFALSAAQAANLPAVKSPDEDAIWAKKSSLKAISDVLARPTQTPARRAALLIRFSEIQQEVAAIQFRVAYAHAGNNAQPDLTEFKASLKQSLDPLNQVITTPLSSHASLPHAYHLRSKALLDLGDKEGAFADLRYLIDTWPQARETPLAHLGLWDLLMEKKDYAGVIHYIQRYGLRTTDKLYGLALEKLAWSYYLLNDLPNAMKYVELEAIHYAALRKAAHDRVSDREKTMSNMALFFATGVASKAPATPAGGVLAYFKKYYAGVDLERILILYGYVLRTKGLDAEIEDLQPLTAQERMSDGFRSDLILLSYDNQINRLKFQKIQAAMQAEIGLFARSATLKSDQKRLVQVTKSFNASLPTLHREYDRYKGQPESRLITDTLISIYRFFLDTPPKKSLDEQVKLHFNVAELLLQDNSLEPAVAEYRWVVDHGDLKSPEHLKMTLEASLKSLSSRYETLKQKQWVAKDLLAKSIQTPQTPLPESVSQWIGWVDRFKTAFPAEKEADTLYFEANRALYLFNQIASATKRLLDFARKSPASPQAIPSASLVIDTLIASERWEHTYKVSQELQKIHEWKDPGFQGRLEVIEADAYFKDVEQHYQKKEYAEVLKQSDAFLTLKPKNKRYTDLLEIAANAELALHDKRGAMRYFETLKREATSLSRDTQATVALTTGSLSESAYDFSAALKSYLEFLSLSHHEAAPGRAPAASSENFSKTADKALFLAWISGSSAALNETLETAGVCSGALAAKCAHYTLLSDLLPHADPTHPPKNATFQEAQLQATRAGAGQGANDRGIWAALALQSASKASYPDRLALLQRLADEWPHLDSIEQYVVLPTLLQASEEALTLARHKVRVNARVRVDRKSIARRTKMMQDAEERMGKLAQLPWAGIRSQCTYQIAGLYRDLSADLEAIPAPPGLTATDLTDYRNTLNEIKAPFDRKALTIESQANPPMDAQARPHVSAAWLAPLLDLGTEQAQDLARVFVDSIEKSNWPKIAFLVQEAKTPKLMPDGTPALFEAISLAKAGAFPEAAQILGEALPQMNRKLREAASPFQKQWAGPLRALAQVPQEKTK